MEKAYEAVLFDLGDTLISTNSSLASAILALDGTLLTELFNISSDKLQQLGLFVEQTIAEFYEFKQLNQPDWLGIWYQAALKAGLSLNLDDIEELARAHLKAFVDQAQVSPYSVPMLAHLKAKGIPVALVSNMTGPREIFDADLSSKGLTDYFDSVVWSCAVGARKPSKEIFQAALCDLNLESSRNILMVGDNETADIKGGNAMGFTTVKIICPLDNRESDVDFQLTGNGLLAELNRMFS